MLAGWLVSLSGCGVTDYEQRIGVEQARLEYFDRENQLLTGPLKIPERPVEKKDDKVPDVIQPHEVFFRPPQGIMTTPQGGGGPVLRLAAVQSGTTPQVLEVQLLVARGKGRDAFRTEALELFKPGGPATERTLTIPGRKPMTVEMYRHEPTNFYVYLLQDDIYHAAVVFRNNKPDLPAMEVSVGTLRFGAEALKQHQAFGQRRPVGK